MKNSKIVSIAKGCHEFSDLPINEQIDYCVSRISVNDKDVEICHILAIFTAYNISEEIYLKYFDTMTTDEIASIVFDYTNGSCQEEDMAWNIIVGTLGAEKVIDITDNIGDYMKTYAAITTPLDEVKDQALRLFTDIRRQGK